MSLSITARWYDKNFLSIQKLNLQKNSFDSQKLQKNKQQIQKQIKDHHLHSKTNPSSNKNDLNVNNLIIMNNI